MKKSRLPEWSSMYIFIFWVAATVGKYVFLIFFEDARETIISWYMSITVVLMLLVIFDIFLRLRAEMDAAFQTAKIIAVMFDRKSPPRRRERSEKVSKLRLAFYSAVAFFMSFVLRDREDEEDNSPPDSSIKGLFYTTDDAGKRIPTPLTKLLRWWKEHHIVFDE